MQALRFSALACLAAGSATTGGALAGERCGLFWQVDDIPTLQAGIVKRGQKRVHFVSSEAAECPSAAESCKRTDYVIGGDSVVIEGRSGDFVCANFVNRKGTPTIGWLPADAIRLSDVRQERPADFVGKWFWAPASIAITRARGGLLSVEGEASHPTTDGRSANTGGIAADVPVENGEIHKTFAFDGTIKSPDKADQYECVVRMRRVGAYLAVADNLHCGGANVTFTGLYAKR